MQLWAWVAVAFLAGGCVGAAVMALLRRGNDLERRMRAMRREYEKYQADVARHFSRTGELLSRLRTTVDQLYSEEEDRATELVAEDALQRRLGYLDNPDRGPTDVPTGTDGLDANGTDAPGPRSGAPNHDRRS